MPSPGLAATWGAEQWAAYVLEHIGQEAVLLRSGARRIDITGKESHVPRLVDDGTSDWIAEGVALPSVAPEADTLLLTPKKVANLVSLSNESISDSSVSTLNAVGTAMTRAVAAKIDSTAFSTVAGTATAPAGLLSYTLPGAAVTAVDINAILDAIGVIEAAGGRASACYLNPADLTAVRKAVTTGGYAISDPTQPGVEVIGGARLYAVPSIAAGALLVAQADQIVVGVRQDASVSFSTDAAFSSDSTLTRIVARVWKWNDTSGAYYGT
jgi:HK97 family phage major capsid protein